MKTKKNPESRIQNPKKALKAFLLSLLLALPAVLHAQDVYDWSYTGTTYSGSGTLAATTGNLVTNIAGIFDGFNITGLVPAGTDVEFTYDNKIFPTQTALLDDEGILFSTADGNNWNLYYNGGFPAYGSVDQSGNDGDLGTFTLTAVPEPSTDVLFGLGTLGLIAAYRRRSASLAQ